jgi:hypothetical protein
MEMSAPTTIKIDSIEYVRKDSIPVAPPVDGCPFIPGESYYFRTVTYHLVGCVTAIIGNFARLENASWVADSGRFMQAIKDGKLSEVEPVGTAFVALSSLTDAFPWQHKLPDTQK